MSIVCFPSKEGLSLRADVVELVDTAVSKSAGASLGSSSLPIGIVHTHQKPCVRTDFDKLIEAARVAQLVEQRICNAKVAGSTPVSGILTCKGEVFGVCRLIGRIPASLLLEMMVRIHPHPHLADVAEMVDASDLGSDALGV